MTFAKTQISIFVLTCMVMISQQSFAQNDTIIENNLPISLKSSNLHFKGYGAVNYYAFDWQSLPEKRNAFDVERFNTYIYYDFSDKIQFKSELEFEHGGTGTTMSFDPLEEFGEFEQEVEKGGSVILEQINILFKIHEKLNIRIGKMRFYMGNASKLDKPRAYFTAYRSEVENTILPLGWYETGIELSGKFVLDKSKSFPHLYYAAYVVSGLDNTGFSSLNWIKNGYQRRFETINADNLAYALRLDYVFGQGSEIGFNFYAGNASGNRPKDDLKINSWVTYGDVHFSLESYPWRARAFGMFGHIQNSEALSNANRKLSNNLNVKRTPVGKMAGGAYTEIAYDINHLWNVFKGQPLYIFGRAEWYDSMFRTQGNVTDNPRYEQKVLTFGVNYFPHPQIVIKSHYAWKTLGSGEHDNTFVTGFGFDF